MKIPYTKKALSFIQQVELLKSRGLIFDDETEAVKVLSHINYYRLSAYMLPFLSDKPNHVFKDGARFHQVLQLYNFDHDLRVLLFDAIGKIEISLKTNILYFLAHRFNAFWITDSALFNDFSKYSGHMAKMSEELKRSDETFLSHYYKKYSDPIPPVWMTVEIASFGLLSQLFENIKSQKIQKGVAHLYGLHLPVFVSWMHSLTYVRNVCAHHARLWNRDLGITPAIPKTEISGWLENTAVSNKRIFIVLSIVIYFLNRIDSAVKFRDSFLALFEHYPEVDTASMGFPKAWKNEPLFREVK